MPDKPKPPPTTIQMAVIMFGPIIIFFAALALPVYVLRKTGRYVIFIVALIACMSLAAILIDFVQGSERLTLINIVIGFAKPLFIILFQLALQIAIIPVAFLVGPVWLFAIFFTLVDIVMRFIPSAIHYDEPLLCSMANIEGAACMPSLIGYHLLMLLLAVLGMNYGERTFNWVADLGANIVENIDDAMER